MNCRGCCHRDSIRYWSHWRGGHRFFVLYCRGPRKKSISELTNPKEAKPNKNPFDWFSAKLSSCFTMNILFGFALEPSSLGLILDSSAFLHCWATEDRFFVRESPLVSGSIEARDWNFSLIPVLERSVVAFSDIFRSLSDCSTDLLLFSRLRCWGWLNILSSSSNGSGWVGLAVGSTSFTI